MQGRSVRTVGVGLLFSAWLAYHCQIPFIRWAGQSTLNYAFDLAIRVESQSVANTLGLDGYLLAIYLMTCLGAGLLAAGLVWPTLDGLLMNLIDLPARLLGTALDRMFQPRANREKHLPAAHS